jgi:hypothetical protein
VVFIAIDDLLPEAVTIGQHAEGLSFFRAEHGRPGVWDAGYTFTAAERKFCNENVCPPHPERDHRQEEAS